MSNWEYKAISSGKGGFATPVLFEKFLNDLGQEEWEIISFHTQPDNPLAFTGLARRSTQRDWTLQDAAAAAARVEAEKLRAEFEAKFKAAKSDAPAAEDTAETFLAEEKVGADDGLRRLRDTSRDDDPEAPEEEGAEKDDWDKLAEEDELPTFFDALRPHMRRNHRGPGMSVGVDYLAKQWRLEESDIRGALVECGLQIPADENAKPVYVEFEGDLFWVNINRRGETWINTREKPEPKFRVVQAKRVTEEDAADIPAGATAEAPAAKESAPAEDARSHRHENRHENRREGRDQAQAGPATGPKTLLDRVRGQMRRNRHGNGWSGSFGYLTKALKTDEAGLLAQFGELGLVFAADDAEKPAFHAEGDFVYWLQRNSRGEIWINARKERAQRDGETATKSDDASASAEESSADASAGAAEVVSAGSPENTLGALRLLLQPKKRGEGVAALVGEIGAQLGRSESELIAALAQAGVVEPADAKAKPTFGEHAGEIFWLNRNAKGELWLNAKAARAKRARSRKKPDGASESEADGPDAGDDNAE